MTTIAQQLNVTSTHRVALENVRNDLRRQFLERNEVIDALLAALLAQEHVLLLGPPGTAKSALVQALCAALHGAEYFQWLLTRFSTPEELFGPVSLSALQQDRVARITAGKLPEAHIAFCDEIFKANSAILNAMLTVINERLFHNDGRAQPCPLISVVGASNELPEGAELEALFDRFLLRFWVTYLGDGNNVRALLTAPSPASSSSITLAQLKACQDEVQQVIVPDIDMALYDAGGLQLDSSGGTTNSETIQYTASAAQTLYVKIYDFNCSNSGSYSMGLDVTGSCTENWSCTNWSNCCTGTKTRTCTDLSSCGTTYNKPVEAMSCTAPVCGDGACNTTCGESGTNCSADCGTPCQCASGVCCDGCLFRTSATICQANIVEYNCPNGTTCGANVYKRSRDQYCSGTSTSCTGAYSSPSGWSLQDDCGAMEVCAPGDPTCNTSTSCCVESWSCGSWSACSCSGLQTRTCNDLNGCGTTNNKPATTQSCDHCGDGTCNCGETPANCATDCPAMGCTSGFVCNVTVSYPDCSETSCDMFTTVSFDIDPSNNIADRWIRIEHWDKDISNNDRLGWQCIELNPLGPSTTHVDATTNLPWEEASINDPPLFYEGQPEHMVRFFLVEGELQACDETTLDSLNVLAQTGFYEFGDAPINAEPPCECY